MAFVPNFPRKPYNLIQLFAYCWIECYILLLTTRFSLKSIPIVGTKRGLKRPSVYWYKRLVLPTPESPNAKNLIKYSLPWSSSSNMTGYSCLEFKYPDYWNYCRKLKTIFTTALLRIVNLKRWYFFIWARWQHVVTAKHRSWLLASSTRRTCLQCICLRSVMYVLEIVCFFTSVI